MLHFHFNRYQMMRRCWCPDPSARPTFDELCTELKSMYNEATVSFSVHGAQPRYHKL